MPDTLWIENHGRRHLVLHPMNGLIRIAGTLESLALEARRLGLPGFALRCGASPNTYNDLGEGIQQTLIGNCLIEGMGAGAG